MTTNEFGLKPLTRTYRIRRKADFGILALIMGMMTLWLGGASVASTMVSADQDAVLRIVSKYLSSTDDPVGDAIKRVGYTPPNEIAWRSLPAAAKLETVYQSAESISAGGGNRALASTLMRMSERYDSLRKNVQVSSFISSYYTDNAIKFNSGMKLTLSMTSGPTREVLILAANYADGQAGGMYRVLTGDFGLTRYAAAEILITSPSNADALVRAFSEVPESERRNKLEKLIKRLTPQYPKIAFEFAIFRFQHPELGGDPSIFSDQCPIGEVECSCGARSLGCVAENSCISGTPCR